MSEAVLVTGGAGFIGSHLVDRLVEAGRRVRVLDSLEAQVHGTGHGHRNPDAEYVPGSVLDEATLNGALDGVEAVVHLAAKVGVGQSMYEVGGYVSDNCLGTARLLERLAAVRDRVASLVVASSMSIYGEGQYACDSCGDENSRVTRSRDALERREWEPVCVRCGSPARPLPTGELAHLEPDSVYATTKRDQEELCLVFGRSFGIRALALRLFNVVGARQSLSNPYTGVAAIFASRLLAGRPPVVFEDGLQSRDFVDVSDVARAFELALDRVDVDGLALNVGTGTPSTVLDVARQLASELGEDLEPDVAGRFRQGDVRHCFADISAIRERLGFEPQVRLPEALRDLAEWIRTESPAAEDRTALATAELEKRGLIL